jgi:hypothetical protein
MDIDNDSLVDENNNELNFQSNEISENDINSNNVDENDD